MHSLRTFAQVIDKKGFPAHSDGRMQRQNAYKFLVKLSENCGILPPTLSVTGITDCGREPVNGGGFADIFRASFRGEEVALKRLRDFPVHQERGTVHRVRISSTTTISRFTTSILMAIPSEIL